MKRNLFIYLSILLFVFYAPIQAQKSITTQEQTIENKVRLNELEKKVAAQDLEMQNVSDKKQDALDSKFELKKENLEFQKGIVGWWLTGLAILITIFGVVIPIGGFFYGRKFVKSIDDDLIKFKKQSEDNINDFIFNSKERMILLEKQACTSIDNLKNYEEKGRDKYNFLDELIKTASNNNNNNNLAKAEKGDDVSQTLILESISSDGEYEKDMLKVTELFKGDDFIKTLDKYFEILKKYQKKIPEEILTKIYFNIAYLYNKLGDTEKSIDYNEKSIKLNPNQSSTWYNLGIEFGNKLDHEKAIDCYRKAIKLKPKYSKAWCNMGRSFDYLGNLNDAVKCYKKSIEIDANNIQSITNLAELLLIIGQIEDSEKYLEKLKNFPNKDEFDYYFLNVIHSVLKNKWEKDVKSTFEELKKTINYNSSTIDWSFNSMKDWLNSEKSYFLTKEHKEYITEFIQLIEVWMEENEK